MTRMAYVLTACVLLTAGQSARAEEVNPKEILEKAKKVGQQLESLSFEASFLGDGVLGKSLPVMDAKVLVAKGNSPKNPRIRIEGAKTMPRGMEPMPFRFVSNGVTASYVDDSRRIHMAGKAEDATPQERVRLLPPLFLSEQAFLRELKAEKLEYGGEREIAGVKCHVIEVTYVEKSKLRSTICIGKEDMIVRSVITPRTTPMRRSAMPNIESAEIFMVSHIEVNPNVTTGTFLLPRPTGYRSQPFVQQRAQRSSGLLKAGSDAPDWTLPDADGNDVSLKSLRGQVVVIDFWASWCGPCKMAMPHLQKLHEKYKDKPVNVFSINCRERGGDARARKYIKDNKLTYPQLFKGDATANAYQVRGIPTMYVIGPDGKIIHSERGFRPDLVPTMSRVIDEHLKDAKTAKGDKKAGGAEKAAKAG